MILRICTGLAVGFLWAQLSGVINQYASVTAILDPSTLQVDDASPFHPGDRILVYQAKGAVIDQSNTASYGDITNIGGAGLFEFAHIQSITGNVLTLQCGLTRPFDSANPTGSGIQVVKVSYHPGNVSLIGTVTAPAWDGNKGGIVAIETEGTLTFAANIDVRGKGFRGGAYSINGGSTSSCISTTYYGSADDRAGRKGEGVANWPGLDHQAYRGKLANGGGGGNDHNTGGAGGGNYGGGGQGGWTTCGSRWFCPGFSVANSGFGIGGMGLASYLTPTNLRLFFGGGGGGGHQNNNEGGNGGPGGGIVIIRAAAIQGGGQQILASGAQGVQNLPSCAQTNVSFSGNDGAGGGGAGGAVALFCASYPSPLTVDVRGANGQNCSSFLCACNPDHGPGGGGGGGYIALSTGGLPPALTLLTAAGLGGVELTPLGENMNGCNNTGTSNCIPAGPDRIQRGAAPGGEGGVLYGIAWSPYSPCPLAELSLLSWTLRPLPNRQVRHTWQLTSAFPLRNILIRMVEKRGSAISEASFFPSLTGEGIQPLLPGEYEALFYAQVEGGQLQLLERRPFRYEGLLLWQEGGNLYLTSPQDTEFVLFDTAGHLLAKGYVKEGETQVLPLEQFPTGFYYLQVGMETYRLPIQTK